MGYSRWLIACQKPSGCLAFEVVVRGHRGGQALEGALISPAFGPEGPNFHGDMIRARISVNDEELNLRPQVAMLCSLGKECLACGPDIVPGDHGHWVRPLIEPSLLCWLVPLALASPVVPMSPPNRAVGGAPWTRRPGKRGRRGKPCFSGADLPSGRASMAAHPCACRGAHRSPAPGETPCLPKPGEERLGGTHSVSPLWCCALPGPVSLLFPRCALAVVLRKATRTGADLRIHPAPRLEAGAPVPSRARKGYDY